MQVIVLFADINDIIHGWTINTVIFPKACNEYYSLLSTFLWIIKEDNSCGAIRGAKRKYLIGFRTFHICSQVSSDNDCIYPYNLIAGSLSNVKDGDKTDVNLQLNIADFIGLPYFSGFPSGLKSHVLISHDFLSQSKFGPLPRDREAMCSRPASKHQKKFCFVSKQACIYCIRSED